jgi:hypothetical protein
VLITPSLGVPKWPVIYIINTKPPTSFLAPLPGIEEEEAPTSTTFSHINYAPANKFSGAVAREKEDFCRGVSHAHSLLCFKFFFTLFLLASFYQKHKKFSFLIVVFLLVCF